MIPDEGVRNQLRWLGVIPLFFIGHMVGKYASLMALRMNPFDGGYIEAILVAYLPWVVSGFLAGWFAISIAPKTKVSGFLVAVVGVVSTGFLAFGAWVSYTGQAPPASHVIRIVAAFSLYLVSVVGAIFAHSSMPGDENQP